MSRKPAIRPEPASGAADRLELAALERRQLEAHADIRERLARIEAKILIAVKFYKMGRLSIGCNSVVRLPSTLCDKNIPIVPSCQHIAHLSIVEPQTPRMLAIVGLLRLILLRFVGDNYDVRMTEVEHLSQITALPSMMRRNKYIDLTQMISKIPPI